MLSKNTLGLLLAMLSILAGYTLPAQRITWGEEPRNYSKNNYFLPIGESAEGIFVMSHSSSNEDISRFSIERLTHNLLFQNRKSIFLKQEVLKKISLLGSSVFIATAPSKVVKGENKLIGALLDKNLEDYHKEQVLLSVQTESKYQGLFFLLRISPDQSHVGAFAFASQAQSKTTTLYYSFYNAALQKKEEIRLELDYLLEEEELETLAIDNQGGFYFVGTQTRKDSKRGAGRLHAFLSYYQFTQKKLVELELTEAPMTVKEATIVYDDSLEQMIVAGFYGDEKAVFQEGVFQYAIHTQTGLIPHYSYTPFPSSFVGDVLGEKLTAQGYLLSNFYIKKLVRTLDGATLLIAERYFTDTYVDQFWNNGQPVSVTKKQYNYDEIIVLRLDSTGSINWHKVIQKKQSSDTDFGYFSSVLVSVLPHQILVMYNDRMGSSKDVLYHRIDPLGNIESGILMSGSDLYTYIVPMEGRQLGYNRMVVPIARNREYSLIKITF